MFSLSNLMKFHEYTAPTLWEKNPLYLSFSCFDPTQAFAQNTYTLLQSKAAEIRS